MFSTDFLHKIMSQGVSGRTTPDSIESGELTPKSTAPNATLEPFSEEHDTAHGGSALTVSTENENGKTSPSKTGGGQSLRTNSPSRLPTELRIKYQTQLTRISCMNNIATSMPEDISTISLTDVETDLEQIEELHRDFATTHSYFELNWPAEFLDHEYFADGFHQQEVKLYRLTKLALNKAKRALTAPAPTPVTHSTSTNFHVKLELPEIPLPKFTGDYSEWPAFKETFTKLVLENERLSNIDRLRYLRRYLEGSPAQLISGFPLVGTSLQPSFESLITRYENKRLLIQEQLDKLGSLTPLTAKSAKGLTALISAVSESRKVLKSLVTTEDLSDHLLVHHVSRNLDPLTRKAWETSLGSSSEFPQFQDLEAFVNSRARALERTESSTNSTQQSTSRARTTRKPVMAPQASTSTPSNQSQEHRPRDYFCDYCNSKHYIVDCPGFKLLECADRREVVVKKKLCFNCLGRHSAKACKSVHTCKRCGELHHTMLHDPGRHVTTQALTSSTSEPEPIYREASPNLGIKRSCHQTKQAHAPPKGKRVKIAFERLGHVMPPDDDMYETYLDDYQAFWES